MNSELLEAFSIYKMSKENKNFNPDDPNNKIEAHIGWTITVAMPFILKFIKKYNFASITGLTALEIEAVRKAITRGFVRGSSMVEIANDIDRVVKDPAKSMLIARTETIRAANEGALDGYKSEDVKRVVFLTVQGDQDDACTSLGGKTFTIENARGVIPVHPNCRCSWAGVT